MPPSAMTINARGRIALFLAIGTCESRRVVAPVPDHVPLASEAVVAFYTDIPVEGSWYAAAPHRQLYI